MEMRPQLPLHQGNRVRKGGASFAIPCCASHAGHKSCSSIRKNQVPQPSTDTNGIILKMFYVIAKGMDQNIVALHTTNGMLDKDANATQGGIGSFLLITQLWVGVLLTLARLPRRDVNLLTSVIRFNA